MDVDVSVSGPVMVAALVNGNDVVSVIDAVGDQATADGTDRELVRRRRFE